MILSWSQFWVACPLTKAKVKKFLEGRTYIFTSLFSWSPREQTCRRKCVKNMLKSLACLVIGKCTMRGHDTPTRSPKFPDTVLANRHRSRKCPYSTVYNVSWNKRFPCLSLEQTPLRKSSFTYAQTQGFSGSAVFNSGSQNQMKYLLSGKRTKSCL